MITALLAQAVESIAEPAARFVERAPEPGLVAQYGPLLAGLLALAAVIYTFVSRTGEAFEKGIKNYLGTDGGRETLDKAVWGLLKSEDFAKWLAEKSRADSDRRDSTTSAGLSSVLRAITDLQANVDKRFDTQDGQLAELRSEGKADRERLRRLELHMARVGVAKGLPFAEEGTEG